MILYETLKESQLINQMDAEKLICADWINANNSLWVNYK